MKSSAVHDWPPFCLWLLPRHSDPLGASLAYTLVILQQLPPISLCRRVSISRVAIVECTCRTNLPFHSHSTMSWTMNFLVCMDIYREGYLLPTLPREVTCWNFNWMLQSSSGCFVIIAILEVIHHPIHNESVSEALELCIRAPKGLPWVNCGSARSCSGVEEGSRFIRTL